MVLVVDIEVRSGQCPGEFFEDVEFQLDDRQNRKAVFIFDRAQNGIIPFRQHRHVGLGDLGQLKNPPGNAVSVGDVPIEILPNLVFQGWMERDQGRHQGQIRRSPGRQHGQGRDARALAVPDRSALGA